MDRREKAAYKAGFQKAKRLAAKACQRLSKSAEPILARKQARGLCDPSVATACLRCSSAIERIRLRTP